jgi:16S rRNA (cytosine967-C5)-methyltransferase
MRIAAGQRRTGRELLAALRPHWRSDAGLPGRIDRLLRGDRRLGSRDRRLYRELIYTALRYLPWIEPLLDPAPDLADAALAWLAADLPATRHYRAVLAPDWPPCPPGAEARAAVLGKRLARAAALPSLLPDWLRAEAPGAFQPAEYDALARRAPLWVRVQAGREEAAQLEWTDRGWSWQRSELLPVAYALPEEANVAASAGYQAGNFEVQDLGSQLVLAGVAPEPGGRWLDACAGAGGKTLQLADLLGPAGRVDVHDVRAEALAELDRRAQRAGCAGQIRRLPAGPATYDGVLIDAPCSGSGTWRRAPHLKWTTRPADLRPHRLRQEALLGRFAPRVRPGGRLVYATCSLCRTENEGALESFLAGHPEFSPEAPPRPFTSRPAGPGFQFWPAGHDGDGFFAASLRRR